MSGDTTTPTTSTAARGPLVLALSDLRTHGACDLDERVRAYREHHGRAPDDASTLRSWIEITPEVSAWIWATRCLGLAGRRLGLAVATAAARRALARVDADPRSVRAVESAEAVLDAYRRGAADDEIARLRAAALFAARAALAATDAAAHDAATDAAYAAAHDAAALAARAARAAATDAVYAAAHAHNSTSAVDAELAQQRRDYLAELNRIENERLVRGDPRAAEALMIADLALDFARVERVTRHQDGQRPETDADHTCMVQLLAVSVALEHFPHLNAGLVALFALVHDLPEVEVGDVDTFTADAAVLTRKAEREAEGRRKLAQRTSATPWISGLVDRYEQQREPEARLVRYVDKLAPALTNVLNRGASLEARGLSPEQVEDIDAPRRRALAEEYPELAGVLAPLLDTVSAISRTAYAARCAEVPTATDAHRLPTAPCAPVRGAT